MKKELLDNPWEANGNGHSAHHVAVRRQPARQGVEIDFRRVLTIWPLMLLSAAIGLFGAWLYLRYAEKVYEVNSEIILEQKQEVTIGEALSGSARDPFNDKIAYFKSPALALQIVDELKLNNLVMAKGRVKTKNLYASFRWNRLGANANDPRKIEFTILPSDNQFDLLEGEKVIKSIKWGTPFAYKGDTLVVNRLSPGNPEWPCFMLYARQVVCRLRT